MILVNDFMGISEDSFFNSQLFLYVIQLGAILAIPAIGGLALYNTKFISDSKDEFLIVFIHFSVNLTSFAPIIIKIWLIF